MQTGCGFSNNDPGQAVACIHQVVVSSSLLSTLKQGQVVMITLVTSYGDVPTARQVLLFCVYFLAQPIV